MKKILLVFLLVFSFTNVNASYNKNFTDATKNTDVYITKFSDYKLFIDNTTLYQYDGNTLSSKPGFNKGGFVNRYEFLTSLGYTNDSYLYSGQKYFTMTESSGKVYEIKAGYEEDMHLVEKTDKSGSKIAEYIISKTKVTGNGSYTNPWMFIKPEFKIKINLTKAKINNTKIFSETINDYETSYQITPDKSIYVFKGDINCTGNVDYKLDKNTNILTLENISTDVTCTVEYKGKDLNVELVAEHASVPALTVVEAETDAKITVNPDNGYAFKTATCTNGQTYKYSNKTFTVENVTSNTICTLNYVTESKKYDYLASNQTYTVPYSGYYFIEGYGARGNGNGGYGGHAKGKIYLNAGQTLTINTGGTAGYNGGGSGQYSGGGATTFKVSESGTQKLLLVAAGGGGGKNGTAGGSDSGAGGTSAGGSSKTVGGGGAGNAGSLGGGGGSGYDYTYNVNCSDCKTGSNTCTGGYVEYNCSSCYYGSNTCSYGCDTSCNYCSYNCSCSSGVYSNGSCVGPYGSSFVVNGYCPCTANGGSGSCSNYGCYDRAGYSRTSTTYNGYGDLTSGCNATTSTSINVTGICSWTGSSTPSCSKGYNCYYCGSTNYNCSYCYYGSNTCSYGCDTYWDECKTGSNTCQYGCDKETKSYNSGKGGTNQLTTYLTDTVNESGKNSSNGYAIITFAHE